MGSYAGKDALRGLVSEVKKTLPPSGRPALKHCVMNEIIKVNGAEATAKSYVVAFFAKGENALVTGLVGRYEDQRVKRGDAWLFKRRQVSLDLVGDLSALQGG
jgi:hypothetical protein